MDVDCDRSDSHLRLKPLMVLDYSKVMLDRCPHCKKKIHSKKNPYRPFCSERCKMIDLGKWLDEEYRVKGTPTDTEEKPASGAPANDNVIPFARKKEL